MNRIINKQSHITGSNKIMNQQSHIMIINKESYIMIMNKESHIINKIILIKQNQQST